jgi:hypothetical protein
MSFWPSRPLKHYLIIYQEDFRLGHWTLDFGLRYAGSSAGNVSKCKIVLIPSSSSISNASYRTRRLAQHSIGIRSKERFKTEVATQRTYTDKVNVLFSRVSQDLAIRLTPTNDVCHATLSVDFFRGR